MPLRRRVALWRRTHPAGGWGSADPGPNPRMPSTCGIRLGFLDPPLVLQGGRAVSESFGKGGGVEKNKTVDKKNNLCYRSVVSRHHKRFVALIKHFATLPIILSQYLLFLHCDRFIARSTIWSNLIQVVIPLLYLR